MEAGDFLPTQFFHAISGRGTIKAENCNLATMERSNRRRIVLRQTLSTRDFDELAQAFPQWDLRCRQLGRARAPTQAGEQGSA
jgi:hypothetical protein